jgi:hypothetical protein
MRTQHTYEHPAHPQAAWPMLWEYILVTHFILPFLLHQMNSKAHELHEEKRQQDQHSIPMVHIKNFNILIEDCLTLFYTGTQLRLQHTEYNSTQ